MASFMKSHCLWVPLYILLVLLLTIFFVLDECQEPLNPVARNQNLNTLDTAEGKETGVGGGAGAQTGAEEMMIGREAGVEEDEAAAVEGEEEEIRREEIGIESF